MLLHTLRTLATLGLTLTTFAAPITKRQSAAPVVDDIFILQFALTLEHLEAAFYSEGFAKFPESDFLALGATPEQVADLIQVGATEATHVKVISDVLTAEGVTPFSPCTYDFKLTDAASMLATAKILEAVGVAAYLGAAPLVERKDVLSAAASIVTIEGRHQTLLRTISKEEAIPQAFDVAVGPQQVFSLAAQFITACPEGSDLGLTALPALNILDAGAVRAGSVLKMDAGAPADDAALMCAFQTGDNATVFVPLEGGQCVVPEGLGGQVFVVISNTEEAVVQDASVVAGPAVLTIT